MAGPPVSGILAPCQHGAPKKVTKGWWTWLLVYKFLRWLVLTTTSHEGYAVRSSIPPIIRARKLMFLFSGNVRMTGLFVIAECQKFTNTNRSNFIQMSERYSNNRNISKMVIYTTYKSLLSAIFYSSTIHYLLGIATIYLDLIDINKIWHKKILTSVSQK